MTGIIQWSSRRFQVCTRRGTRQDCQHQHRPGNAPVAEGRTRNRQDDAGPCDAEALGMRLIVLNVKSSMKLIDALYQYDTLTRLNDSRFETPKETSATLKNTSRWVKSANLSVLKRGSYCSSTKLTKPTRISRMICSMSSTRWSLYHRDRQDDSEQNTDP